MNFTYGIIVIVGLLIAFSLGMIAMDPGYLSEAPLIPTSEKPTVCTKEHLPQCGVDGQTYGNLCTLNTADVELAYKGECVVPEPESITTGSVEMEPTPETTMDASSMATQITPQTHTVSLPEGSGVPGCQETSECYIPHTLEIQVQDTVSWSNDDTAAHTVTSGSAADGTTGIFDSSLFMPGTTFEFTFDKAGSFPYFCVVHPWMMGEIIVNEFDEMIVIPETTPKETTPKETTPKETTPKETTPKETTPKETTPKETTPKETTPKETTPKETTPKETTPKETTPKETTPKETTPKETTPKETTPKETTPKETTPKETTPKETTPKETTPKETTPKETTPKETTPKETTPKETTPKETTPKETTPKETTPKETTPKEVVMEERQAGPTEVTMAQGSGAPGCEQTDGCYLPSQVEISSGDTVIWFNTDSAAHTVTSGSHVAHDGKFDSGMMMVNQSWAFTFTESGGYDYHCVIHPWMTGKVMVS